MIKPIYIFFLLIIASSCEKDIEYKFKNFQAQMVVNAFISPQEGIQVQVSSSIPPNQDVPKPKIWVNNAKVSLYLNEQFFMQVPFQKSGIYTSPIENLNPDQSNKYHIVVEHPEFGTITSEAISIPSGPIGLSSTLESSTNLGLNGDPQLRWVFRLKDTSTAEGAYLTVINLNDSKNAYSESPPNITLLNIKIGQFCDLIYTYGNHLLLNNECIRGQEVDLTFEFDVPNRIGGIGQNFTPDLIECKFYAVSKDFYEYYRTQNRPEDFELAFSDPEPLFTNMKGGYGVFLAFNYAEFSFPIPK
jgi:hypothetical protein